MSSELITTPTNFEANQTDHPFTEQVRKVGDVAIRTNESATKLVDQTSKLVSNANSFASSIKDIAQTVANCKTQVACLERQLDAEIKKMKIESKSKLDKMQFSFEVIKSSIQHTHKTIDDLISQLKSFDLNNMDEKQHETYGRLLLIISNTREQLLSLYDKIL